jgi:hypothetical protein
MAGGLGQTRPRESGSGQQKGSTDQNDRAGGARSDARPAGKGGAPSELACNDDDGEDGCGNGVPMETPKRFPQGLGNLAENARFPHSHKPMIIVLGTKEEPEPVTKVSPMYPV